MNDREHGGIVLIVCVMIVLLTLIVAINNNAKRTKELAGICIQAGGTWKDTPTKAGTYCLVPNAPVDNLTTD